MEFRKDEHSIFEVRMHGEWLLAVEAGPCDGKTGAVRTRLAHPLLVRTLIRRSSHVSRSAAMKRGSMTDWTLAALAKLLC